MHFLKNSAVDDVTSLFTFANECHICYKMKPKYTQVQLKEKKRYV